MARDERSTRREMLRTFAATGAALGFARCGIGLANDEPRPAKPGLSGEDALDEALRLLHRRDEAGKGSLSSHASMVAEALCVLGYADRIVPFVEGYDARPNDLQKPSRPIAADDWRAALGRQRGGRTWEASLQRFGDWKEFFKAEVAQGRWQDVLDTWTDRLAAGLSAAATHGVIRTSHAARALSRKDTPERRAELARGLAYWATAYQELPAKPGRAEPTETFASALARLPLHREIRGDAPGGNIVEGLHQAGLLEGFDAARDIVATPADVAAGLSALTKTFAGVYLQHGTRAHAIAFVHAVTAPCALRKIAPHVKPETARAAFPYAWQAAAGIYSAYASSKNEPTTTPEPSLSTSELAARAVENGADHAVKFTEALLAENELSPDPVYLAAAEDAVRRL